MFHPERDRDRDRDRGKGRDKDRDRGRDRDKDNQTETETERALRPPRLAPALPLPGAAQNWSKPEHCTSM